MLRVNDWFIGLSMFHVLLLQYGLLQLCLPEDSWSQRSWCLCWLLPNAHHQWHQRRHERRWLQRACVPQYQTGRCKYLNDSPNISNDISQLYTHTQTHTAYYNFCYLFNWGCMIFQRSFIQPITFQVTFALTAYLIWFVCKPSTGVTNSDHF